jgi:hypothetical protein
MNNELEGKGGDKVHYVFLSSERLNRFFNSGVTFAVSRLHHLVADHSGVAPHPFSTPA